MHERLGVPEADAQDIWRKAFAAYNQSLKGLKMSGFEFDEAEYWDYIRQGAESFLKPDPKVFICCSVQHMKTSLKRRGCQTTSKI